MFPTRFGEKILQDLISFRPCVQLKGVRFLLCNLRKKAIPLFQAGMFQFSHQACNETISADEAQNCATIYMQQLIFELLAIRFVGGGSTWVIIHEKI